MGITEKDNIKVRIIRRPTQHDWERCKDLALHTIGKKWTGSEVTEEWKRKMLKCKHSPIRTLMFTIEMEVPYFVSTHFVRHKFGVEHYVQSQRNDRQSSYDRDLAPQSAMVTHVMDINADALMNMAHRRLCTQADITTRYVMSKICQKVIQVNPEFIDHLVPMCEFLNECPEITSCGKFKGYVREPGTMVYVHRTEEKIAGVDKTESGLLEGDLCSHY